MRSALDAAGIGHQVRNEMLGGAVGEIPPTEATPEIWVNEVDIPKALEVLEQIKDQDSGGPSWKCICGEIHESQFSSCWKCGAAQPD